MSLRDHAKEVAASGAAAVPCDCETDPIACIKQMFVDMVQLGRIQRGQCPARRPVFLRLHGVVHGRLEVLPNLPPELGVGLFAEARTFPAWVRFSSDIPDGYPDLKSTVGVGIKLFDVPGRKAFGPDDEASTVDFTFQNIDVFFVDNAHDMCAFTKASFEGASAQWLKDHPRTAAILDAMEKVVPTALGENYWSVIPYHLGDGRYCKYKFAPETIPPGGDPDYNDPDYLKADLTARLAAGEARFKLLVQLQTEPALMPLDQATVAWDENMSPPIHVATLILPAQEIGARGQSAYGEELAFHPWRTLAEYEPVGSIAEARKVVYEASATLRRNVNGQPIAEPAVVRPATDWPAGKDTKIVRAAIHPGIGIARIGNSTAPGDAGFYIGPEVTNPPPTLAGQNRDASGAIMRQAARFRIYGYNAAGEVVKELGADNAHIVWTAHLANRKAEWYRFLAALDLPEAATLSCIRRNKDVPLPLRGSLAIDPGPRDIEGKDISGPAYQFDTGTFQGTPVPLGEIRTDDAGHLLVLGGLGTSASPTDKPIYDPADADSFNNANGWYDDISDGPVTASVSIAGRAIPVDPAWVVVAPPNYAPDVIGWRTLYDLLVDTYVADGWLPLPETVSFTNDVLPTLYRLTNLQWVNKGFAAMFGAGGPLDFTDPSLIAKLSWRPPAGEYDVYQELRQTIFNSFRPSDNTVNEPRSWPWIYGDAFGSFNHSPENNLALSQVRSYQLSRWVEGDFIADWPASPSPQQLSDVPLTEQPAMLDEAALHFCLADAFHPGCEITWPIRHTSMFMSPFRIRHRPEGEPEPDYGSTLTQANALAVGGPLYAQGPGDISRWMALPWQGDTAFCRSGYEASYDPYVPTFWPARVPNEILTDADYQKVMDTSLKREQRLAAFSNRPGWLRSLTGPAPQQMLQMVAHFGQMGIVEQRPGIADDPDFPPVMWVESLPAEVMEEVHGRTMALLARAAAAPPVERRLLDAGWESQEQLEEFRAIRIRH